MTMQPLFNRILRLSAFTFLPAGLLAMSIPIGPANARNMYDVCIGSLIAVGVSPQQAATACAGALIPKELSKCVSKVALTISVTADAAVDNCYRSRRPVDVGNCVIDINNEVPLNQDLPKTNRVTETFSQPDVDSEAIVSSATQSVPLLVLESCRRSLQPGVYSQCVTAVSRDIALDTLRQALNTCLSAEAFPPTLFPTYPQNQ